MSELGIQAGNRLYRSAADLPDRVPVFPLAGALLLPGGHLPLNIFEARYIEMIDAALAGDRLIGMIQPTLGSDSESAAPPLCEVGCLGRIVQFSESGDGRYLIALSGVSRFRVVEEVQAATRFRQCRISLEGFSDLTEPREGEERIDRNALLTSFRDYLRALNLEADWEGIEQASNIGLVTAFAMMSPWPSPEKQALLEAPNHASRAELLIAMAEIAAAGGSVSSAPLQ
jgi:Lon protease-like protein